MAPREAFNGSAGSLLALMCVFTSAGLADLSLRMFSRVRDPRDVQMNPLDLQSCACSQLQDLRDLSLRVFSRARDPRDMQSYAFSQLRDHTPFGAIKLYRQKGWGRLALTR